jgi:hypothetical protein
VSFKIISNTIFTNVLFEDILLCYFSCVILALIDWARKSVSPAFSRTNLDKRLPEIRQKIAQFTTILDQHIDDNKPLINVPSWMVKLTYSQQSYSLVRSEYTTSTLTFINVFQLYHIYRYLQ